MRVLIVDDSAGVARFLADTARLFKAEHVDQASSGEEALAFATRMTYDLVTLDIRMPGVTELDILSLVRSLCPHASDRDYFRVAHGRRRFAECG